MACRLVTLLRFGLRLCLQWYNYLIIVQNLENFLFNLLILYVQYYFGDLLLIDWLVFSC